MTAIGRYLEFVKIEHTLFALPFALVGMLTASGGRPPVAVLLWIVVAMVGARSAAMAFNRILDRDLDARNPRTADRHLPAGKVGLPGSIAFTALAAAVFVLASWRLNDLCFALSPVALAAVFFYSATKRFTSWSPLFLGLGLAIAPVGAWLAVTGAFALFPLLTAAGVLFWVAGFDTIYGCQDVDFDRRSGLYSPASRFGVVGALRLARALHILAVLTLAVAVRVGAGLGVGAAAGVAVMGLLLVLEHRVVAGGDLRRIDMAFFTLNSWAGTAVLGGVLLDLYLF